MGAAKVRKLGIATAVVAALLMAVQWVVPALLREPLARWVEQSAAGQIHGYRLSLRAVTLNPLGLGIQLQDLALQDDDASEPPLLRAPVVDAGIGLAGLFRFRTETIVRNASIELDPARVRAALDAELGGQLLTLGRDAVATLGRFRTALGTIVVEDAALRWLDTGGDVTLSAVALRVENASREDAGGADDLFALRVEARPPDSGLVQAEGESALFASEPPPMDLRFGVEKLSLPAFAPLARRARLDFERGVASARGRVQLAGRSLRLDLAEASLVGAEIDWRHTAATWAAEAEALRAASARLRTLLEGWAVAVTAGRLAIERSTFGVRDASADPPYRVFALVESAALSGFATASGSGPATLIANGRLMGTGRFDVNGSFRSGSAGAEVGLELGVQELALPTLNEALVAHGALPLVAGTFSLALDGDVRSGRISGQVTPLLADVEVREKEDAGLVRSLAKKTVDVVASLLENERGNIATSTTLSGTLPSPTVGILEALVGLLRNAFVESIAPEFERAVGARG
jgi:hypothetical protein